jgi:hypothetical protein
VRTFLGLVRLRPAELSLLPSSSVEGRAVRFFSDCCSPVNASTVADLGAAVVADPIAEVWKAGGRRQ